jgi:tRNA(Ile)-lysidine synthetase-like protein
MDFRRRFVKHLLEVAQLEEGDRVVVACSGGLDSCVLLHLLCFSSDLPDLEITVAHFDHAMRPGSEADAHWVRGLATAWSVKATLGQADPPPANEADARLARYGFLREVREAERARWLFTAHHGDDQAETVLFRALRGTGLAGLAGIPTWGPGGLVRPLLPFRRAHLEAYARRYRVPSREDPTNLHPRYARNVIRHEILPRAEAAVAPGAPDSLIRLARLARRDEEAWRSLMPTLLEGVLVEAEPDRTVLALPALRAYHGAVRGRLLREVARRMGVVLGEAGTRSALEFTSSSASGRRHSLPGGLVLTREFDRLVLYRYRVHGDEEALEIREPGEGQATFTLSGRTYLVVWARSPGPEGAWAEAFASEQLEFPLRLRGWIPGDRIRMRYGTKKLKKLFAEMQVPAGERSRRPVLADGRGEVVWVPGLARSVEASAPFQGNGLIIAVRESGRV